MSAVNLADPLSDVVEEERSRDGRDSAAIMQELLKPEHRPASRWLRLVKKQQNRRPRSRRHRAATAFLATREMRVTGESGPGTGARPLPERAGRPDPVSCIDLQLLAHFCHERVKMASGLPISNSNLVEACNLGKQVTEGKLDVP